MSDVFAGAAKRALTLSIALSVLLLLPAGSALAHNGTGKLRGVCQVDNLSGRGTITVTVSNLWSGSVTNVTPSDLLASGTGTATFFLQTSPRPFRELLPGKDTDLVWHGRLYGEGVIDLSVEVLAQFEDGHIESTGIVNCNRLVVGNPGDPGPTNTPAARPTNTPVARPTNTPGTGVTPPSPTPPGRPTRTPRLDPTATATRPRPTSTPTSVLPTATFTRVPPTATPTRARPTRTPIPDRPTRTPIVFPTRTSTPSRPPRPSATQTPPRPTNTPLPDRPPRTRIATATSRPTRTPNLPQATPTRAPTGSSDPPSGALTASCSLRRNVDFVTIIMAVQNHAGFDIQQLAASPLSLEPEGGSLFFDRTGPSPVSAALVHDGATATFQWTGRLSPGGTMGFGASASATSAHGPFTTGLVDCGVTGSDAGNFDPSSFSGTCSLQPGDPGTLKVEIRNGSRETLENVEAGFVARTTTGTAALTELRGPAPRSVNVLNAGARREFDFGGRFLGSGEVRVQFEAKGTRGTTNDRISTGRIECAAQVGGSGGNLPDLGVDQQDLRDSVLIESKDFPPDNCAVFEGCVDGTGNRKLLRFNTTTPNYGPGDVFLGNPQGNPNFVYSACHNHYHFSEYADYRLLDMAGNIVARGHKQAFCLVDLWQPPGLHGRGDPQFDHCGYQGISAGWADVYNRGLDCQWIDITGVPSGRYVLSVTINPAHVIQEHDYSNNSATAEVVIP
ncbi:MAG TPA: lysyl oxidase family protein [Candidatus Dormibacteraeota bacterium]|nr:lysyl oxidase family protein [Candidatus Dormibacteraeota bacterium]